MNVKKKKPINHHYRAVNALIICIIMILIIHFSWRAGYRANPIHHSTTTPLIDTTGLPTNLSHWWTWLVPACITIFLGAFREFITDLITKRFLKIWNRIKG